ncbi:MULTISPECIES: GntR family transcriptional regulator [Arthrobacter]|uniref:DNA-binding GntR family transcriptional regulator n=1 Tax=Arthrobacter bambusae TaxID=1338426 RepID=A0AAW8DL74_9MICC|nr:MULTISPECIES: GntR family transcriptional regulator [Arthrobacter]MDP9907266.1 DNA-binding GntR family transcriptional regulator [Arthrobacter bambusae]MDQ0131402.1 DNA-binding GntR family transcriptional regulator [Arthrobacter bambusae]MDQ0182736.1 DNA-binding GntR family transcriptional regulator [Arthrobacter bambusae]
MSTISAFDKRTLRERCTQHVRDQIISGAIKPGEHLKEIHLSEEMGVSRGTLREALRPLEIEGLIVDDGKRHMRVRELTSQEILDVFEVRSTLETLAAKRIVASAQREDLTAELRRCLEPLREPGLEFAQQLELDLKFHEQLCALAGNPTLLASWRNLIGQIEMMIIAAGPDKASGRMRFDEHIQIVEAIESGVEEEAVTALRDHMNDFCSRYVGDLVEVELQDAG